MTIKQIRSLFNFAVVSFITITFAASVSFAQAEEDKTLSPYFFVEGNGTDRLPLKSTKVDIAVSGIIADVKVTQNYQNTGRRPINAIYMFPASTRAAVYSMRMKIGNEVIIAKIREREKAKKEYETAKKQGKSASLLEQKRPNVFSMKMANLMPGDEIEIELRYTELLIPTNGIYELVYPTVVGPRYSSEKESDFTGTKYSREGEKPTSELTISTRISSGVPLQNLKCDSHQIEPNWLSPSLVELKLNDADPFSGNRDFILRYSLAGSQINSGLLLFEGVDENFFLYMAQPPKTVRTADIPSREYIFVVDVSGSMNGFPLETSKKLLKELIDKLRPSDFFNVVLFSGDSTALSEVPLPASEYNLSRALKLLDEQRGMGGTELLGALKQAMNLQKRSGVSRSIVLITDGYISAEADVLKYIRENLGQSNIFSFGIGSSVNRYLIEGVAKAGMGEPFILTDESESADVAKRFLEYIQSPLLTDIKVRPVGFETYDVFPVQLPDLMAQRPVIVFGKWRGPVSGTFELTGKTGAGDYSEKLDISGVSPDAANGALRYLWARSRISELSDYSLGQDSEVNREQITSLGIKYNLLTQYTSFIAVREIVRNPDGSAEDVSQRLPLPVGVSNFAVGSEPEMIWLLFGGAIIALIILVGKRRQSTADSPAAG